VLWVFQCSFSFFFHLDFSAVRYRRMIICGPPRGYEPNSWPLSSSNKFFYRKGVSFFFLGLICLYGLAKASHFRMGCPSALPTRKFSHYGPTHCFLSTVYGISLSRVFASTQYLADLTVSDADVFKFQTLRTRLGLWLFFSNRFCWRILPLLG